MNELIPIIDSKQLASTLGEKPRQLAVRVGPLGVGPFRVGDSNTDGCVHASPGDTA